jgi:hypothetical protein
MSRGFLSNVIEQTTNILKELLYFNKILMKKMIY